MIFSCISTQFSESSQMSMLIKVVYLLCSGLHCFLEFTWSGNFCRIINCFHETDVSNLWDNLFLDGNISFLTLLINRMIFPLPFFYFAFVYQTPNKQLQFLRFFFHYYFYLYEERLLRVLYVRYKIVLSHRFSWIAPKDR